MPTTPTQIPIAIKLSGGTKIASIKLIVKNLNTGQSETVETNNRGEAVIDVGNQNTNFSTATENNHVIEVRTQTPDQIGSATYTVAGLKGSKVSLSGTDTSGPSDSTTPNTPGVTI